MEKLRRAYEAFSRGDFDAAIEIVHPEIEFVRAGGQSPVEEEDVEGICAAVERLP